MSNKGFDTWWNQRLDSNCCLIDSDKSDAKKIWDAALKFSAENLKHVICAELEKLENGGKVPVRKGQIINTKRFGKIRFNGFDYYCGQKSAHISMLDHGRDNFTWSQDIEEEGFVLIG